jgi:hypothetical protein
MKQKMEVSFVVVDVVVEIVDVAELELVVELVVVV